MPDLVNHCAECGKEIEPEEEFCEECAARELDPCPECGKVICECDTGAGD